MSKKFIKHDPHANREANKYPNPIPSREYIMEVLEKSGRPVRFDTIVTELELDTAEELQALDFRLRAMLRDGQLMQDRRQRYCLVTKLELIKGRVIGHPDGFGFVHPDEEGEDLFLSPKEMRQVMHGDRVLAREVRRDNRGRREGMIFEVIERNTTELVGRLYIEKGVAYVQPDNKRAARDIYIPPNELNDARNEQIVTVEIISQPTAKSLPIGRIKEILGNHMAPGMEIDIAIRAHEIPHFWPGVVEDEAAALPKTVTAADHVGRVDLRELPLVTIDGEDARDFDDAVFCAPRKQGGWRLYVAIADVSYYVKPDSALDQEASVRGTSVYFPERVIPMLPEALSNDLCSLNPNVDRLCMVCDMTITTSGRVTGYEFYPAVMHSKARLTYTKVAGILVDNDATLRAEYSKLVPDLENLYALYQVLHEARKKRGAIDFDTVETRILFGPDKKIVQIVPLKRNEAHRIIEECMLLANICAAKFLEASKIPCLYRIHAPPSEDRIGELREFLDELGLGLRGGRKPKTKDFAELLASLDGRPDKHLIQTVMLRTLSQAVYSPENVGHFGLAYDAYTHFTSPIRRYPDLIVHRAIRHVLATGSAEGFTYEANDIVKLGTHCSTTERRADEATRDAVDWLKCEYMLDHVGKTYDGVIVSVTNFGLFVELRDIYVEGLVHVTALDGDYYRFDQTKHRLRGERTGKTYRLGDSISVTVARVDLDERKIDFVLA